MFKRGVGSGRGGGGMIDDDYAEGWRILVETRGRVKDRMR
jgi:hypothetical protein